MFIGYVHIYIYIWDLGNKQLMLMGIGNQTGWIGW